MRRNSPSSPLVKVGGLPEEELALFAPGKAGVTSRNSSSSPLANVGKGGTSMHYPSSPPAKVG
jgi:hypothetical protein